jgi:hypothetical protein
MEELEIMSIDELEVTLKMLNIKHYYFNVMTGERYLFIKIIDMKLKGVIKDLLIKHNIEFIEKNSNPKCYVIYIEVEGKNNEC